MNESFWATTLDWPITLLAFRLIVFSALGALLAAAWTRALRLMWAVGIDRRRRLAHTHAPLRFLLTLLVVLFVLAPLQEANPLGTAALGLIGLLTAGIWGYGHLRDIASGLTLSIRRPFHLGDEIGTNTITGHVIGLSLTRVRVETSTGKAVDLPTSELMTGRLQIASRDSKALPIEVVVPLPGHTRPDELVAELRDHALLSPYTDVSAPVTIELVGAQEAKVWITPVRAEEADELRTDLIARARELR